MPFVADYVIFECDGVPYTISDGRPYPTDEFGTATNIEIVGLAPTMNCEEEHRRAETKTPTGKRYSCLYAKG